MCAQDDDLPTATVRVQKGVPHPLPEPLRVGQFLPNEQASEVRVRVADHSLYDTGGTRKTSASPLIPATV